MAAKSRRKLEPAGTAALLAVTMRLKQPPMSAADLLPASSRRPFLKHLGALVFGGLAALLPPVAGLTVFLDPLRRGSNGVDKVRVATLSALPEDGTPRRF